MNAEERAYQAIEADRWPNGPICPHCGSVNHAYYLVPKGGSRTTRTGKATYRRLWKCGDCRKQFSVLVGTVLEASPVPLSKWLLAIRLIEAHGRTITELAQALHVSYRTARSMRDRASTLLLEHDWKLSALEPPATSTPPEAQRQAEEVRLEFVWHVAQAIIPALERAGTRGLTRSDIWRFVGNRQIDGRRVTREVISEAMFYEISVGGFGDWLDEDSGGRPTQRWWAKEFYPFGGWAPRLTAGVDDD